MLNRLTFCLVLGTTAPIAAQACFQPPGPTLVADFNSPGDAIYAPQPIGFPFPLGGATYTDIHLSDHCFGFLSNGGVPTVPGGGPLTYNVNISDFIGNGPCIAAFWADCTLGVAGTLTIASSATRCVVTWTDVQTFASQPPPFSVQLTLFPSGEVTVVYDPQTDNRVSACQISDAIVGITPGAPAVLPAASDLSSGVVTTADPTVFEEFLVANTFDLANNGLRFIPTNPGWVVTTLGGPAGCAQKLAYGDGCVQSLKAFYEEFAVGAFDIASGTTITLLRQANGYIALDGIAGTFVMPGAGALNIAAGLLDGEQTVPLSGPMPIAGGTTNSLTITTKGYISLTGVSVGIDFTPTVGEFLAFSEPLLAPMWHDWNQTAPGSGLILFEEVSGIAYATWNGVYSFAGTSVPNTFQVQFDVATGDITIVYQSIVNDGPNYLVGYKAAGNPADTGQSDLSVDLASTIVVGDVEILPLTLDSDTPRLGANWNLTTSNIDPLSPISITFFGNTMIPVTLPLSVIGLNAPGCFVHIDAVLGDATRPNVGGSSVVVFPIPNTASLTGLTISAQSICLTLQNLANILTSNGLLGTIGQ